MSRFTYLLFLYLIYSACQSGKDVGPDIVNRSESTLATDANAAIIEVDSLLNSPTSKNISPKTRLQLRLIRQRAYAAVGVMDSVLSAGISIRTEAEKLRDSLSIARSLLPVRGEVSMVDQQAIVPYLPGAASTFRKQGMHYEEAVINGLTGAIQTREGRFTDAMGYLYQARDTLERLDSIRPLYAVYMNIGNNLSAMKNPHPSIDFYRKARSVAVRMKDSLRQASSWMNEGIAYSYMGILDSSRMAFEQGIRLTPTKGGDLITLQLRYNLATLEEKRGDNKQAEYNYRMVLDRSAAMGDPVGVAMATSGLAGVYGSTGRSNEAIRLLNTAILQLDSLNLNHYILEQTSKLVAIYKLAGRYAEALTASERLRRLNDSLVAADRQKSVQELEVKYQRERQEMENTELREEVRQRTILTVILISLIVLLGILMMVLRQRNRYHRALVRTYERLLDDYRRRRDEPVTGRPAQRPLMHDLRSADESMDEDDEYAVDPIDDDVQKEATSEDIQWFDQMMTVLRQEKPFLNHRFKMEDISRRLDIPARRLTQISRKMTGQSLSQLLNRLRVEEASRIMEDRGSAHLKIDAIASMCGFSNRQHFRRVFEQVTGVNPGFYRSRTLPDVDSDA
jgi:AraC-like DNA-binding protein